MFLYIKFLFARYLQYIVFIVLIYEARVLVCIVYMMDIIIIIMVTFKCYFSTEHIALSLRKIKRRCLHRIMKNKQIKSTVHDAISYLK